jgi:hypothetical protein
MITVGLPIAFSVRRIASELQRGSAEFIEYRTPITLP